MDYNYLTSNELKKIEKCAKSWYFLMFKNFTFNEKVIIFSTFLIGAAPLLYAGIINDLLAILMNVIAFMFLIYLSAVQVKDFSKRVARKCYDLICENFTQGVYFMIREKIFWELVDETILNDKNKRKEAKAYFMKQSNKPIPNLFRQAFGYLISISMFLVALLAFLFNDFSFEDKLVIGKILIAIMLMLMAFMVLTVHLTQDFLLQKKSRYQFVYRCLSNGNAVL